MGVVRVLVLPEPRRALLFQAVLAVQGHLEVADSIGDDVLLHSVAEGVVDRLLVSLVHGITITGACPPLLLIA